VSGYLHRVNWAKLPDGRQLTDVASVAADSKDQIYAFAAPIRWWWSSVNNSDSASIFLAHLPRDFSMAAVVIPLPAAKA